MYVNLTELPTYVKYTKHNKYYFKITKIMFDIELFLNNITYTSKWVPLQVLYSNFKMICYQVVMGYPL